MKKLCVAFVMLISSISLIGGVGTRDAMAAEQETVKLLKFNWNFDPKTDPAVKAVEKVTGVDFEITMLPSDPQQMLEKLMLETAAGTYYDLYQLNSTGPQNIGVITAKLASTKQFLPLNELLESHGQNILALTPPELWQEVTFDGEIYGIPAKKNMPCNMKGVVFRKDILDQLNLAVPTTPEEFYQVLKAVKDNTDMIPLVGEKTSPWIDGVTSGFGFPADNVYHEVEGKLVARAKHPGFIEYLKFMNRLYTDGLLDQEFPATTRDIRLQKISAGKAFAFIFFWWDWQVLDTMRENVPEAELAWMPPLQDADGNQAVSLFSAGNDFVTLIPKVAKNPEFLVSMLDRLVQPDNYSYAYIGQEGVEYVTEGESWKPTQKYRENRLNAWTMLLVTNKDLLRKQFFIGIAGEHPDVVYVWKGFQDAIGENGVLPPEQFDPQGEKRSKLQASLDQLEIDFTVKVISGAESADSYGEFLKTYDQEGGAQVEVEVNELHQ